MSKVLITGVNGFVGQHLVRELHDDGHMVVGLGYGDMKDAKTSALLTDYASCDLTDKEAVAALPLRNVSAIINLAGLANVGASFDNPELFNKVNVEVLTNLCDKIIKNGISARVIAVSTGAVYAPNQPMPLTEESSVNKSGPPYAYSKLMMEAAAQRYRSKGLDCVVARPFNHSGPGQAMGFLIPDLYQQLLESKQNNHILKVGNLDTRRDYTDVRDIVRGYVYLALAEELHHDTYNICSGHSSSGREVLKLLMEETGLSDVSVEVDQSLIRPTDPLDLYGSYERLNQETDWLPKIPLERTVHDFVSWAKQY